MPRVYHSLEERFWSKVDKNGPVPPHMPHLGRCWIWTAAHDRKGYGVLMMKRDDGLFRIMRAHRIAWFLATGKWPIPCALHHCDNRSCVRVKRHLFEGTKADNRNDCVAKGRGSHAGAVGDRNGARLHPERMTRGEQHHSARLTEKIVREIRSAAQSSSVCRNLADAYDVSYSLVYQIRRRTIWKHVN